METHLLYLVLTAGLGVILWIPPVIGLVTTFGGLPKPESYREAPDPYPECPAWVRRANRTHINYVENVAPFAILVIVAHLLQKGPDIALWTAIFFWARVAHAGVFWLGIAYVRTVAFTVGFAAQVAIFVLLF